MDEIAQKLDEIQIGIATLAHTMMMLYDLLSLSLEPKTVEKILDLHATGELLNEPPWASTQD